MGVEAFIYPFLILTSALASAILAVILRRALGPKYRFAQYLLIAVAVPLIVIFVALVDPETIWESARFSIGIVASISCFVALAFASIRTRQ